MTIIDTPPASHNVYEFVLARVRDNPESAVRFDIDCELRDFTGLKDWLAKATDEHRDLVQACICAAVHVAYCQVITDLLRARHGGDCDRYDQRSLKSPDKPRTVEELVGRLVRKYGGEDPLYEGGTASEVISAALKRISRVREDA